MKHKTTYICQECGASFSKWLGRCENCGNWNTLVEQAPTEIFPDKKGALAKAGLSGKVLDYTSIGEVEPERHDARILTGFPSLDLVLGGGILRGSVSLLAGQPGIGKSTILMQIAKTVSANKAVLYVSGEESAAQVSMRAQRLGATDESLNFASSTSANDIAQTIATGEFALVIIDSIQTIALNELSSAAGTVSQVTHSGNLIIQAAKSTSTAVVIVGHVTKDGGLAGPKVLEHLVDVVLNFEGDRYNGFKIVRAAKNRFGPTSETAIFTMETQGLQEVENPSALLLAERSETDGSIILATLEGSRPILVEIQALANKSSFGYPRRTCSGFDLNRLNLLIAVLERRTRMQLFEQDIFINVVGGLRLQDPAADLAICLAIASAVAGRKLSSQYVVFGEVGLSGEVRSVFRPDQRIAEAKKFGFTHALAPATIKDPFVLPITDLRTTLMRYIKER